jgi:hypothetical protein
MSRRTGATSSSAASTTGGCGGGGIKYAVIQFKHLKDTFFVPSTERQGLQIGDYVVVEGDRGENVGQLLEDLTPTHQRNDPIAGRVVRKATLSDRRQWENARRREVEATAMCQVFAEEFDVEMFVSDTEFQTDLNKLTIYYRTTCEGPVDFRQMQRALFKHYRCRIWLVDLTNTEMWGKNIKFHLCRVITFQNHVSTWKRPQWFNFFVVSLIRVFVSMREIYFKTKTRYLFAFSFIHSHTISCHFFPLSFEDVSPPKWRNIDFGVGVDLGGCFSLLPQLETFEKSSVFYFFSGKKPFL